MRKIYLSVFLLAVFSTIQAQSYGLIGKIIPNSKSLIFTATDLNYCFSDIGGTTKQQVINGLKNWDVLSSKYLVSLGFRQSFINNISYRVSVSYGNFTGDDKNAKNSARHLSFESQISSINLVDEYTLLGGFHSNIYYPYSLYIFGGIGLCNSHATVKKDGIPINEFPPNRPDDKIKLNETSFSLPYGIGYEYFISPRIAIGAELMWNYAFNDFLDGISTVSSKKNDLLTSFNLTFSYKLSDSIIRL
jgi:opacity protein-like surface antigen